MVTRPKLGSWNFSDQGIFTSANDVGCRSTNSAAANKALIVTALTAMTSGGVLVIPHGIPHNFTAADFPVTAESLCVWEITGNSFKLITNTTTTSLLGQVMSPMRFVEPKAIQYELVDTLTDPATYTFKHMVYNNAGSPVIAGSSYDVCLFVPGIATPVEATARSGVVPGRKYLFKGLNLNGTVIGGKQIVVPAESETTAILLTSQNLILNHSATVAAHGLNLPTAPWDGYTINVYSRSIITTLVLTAGAGHTIATGHDVTTIAAGASFALTFDSTTAAWYRTK